MKRTLKYAGGLALVAGFVTLLTIIFSFLGAFFCAGLFGMMLGTTRIAKGLVPFASAIPPLVLLGVLLAQKTELVGRQILIVVLLCLGTFWVLYLGALALLAFEKQAPTDSESTGSVTRPDADSGQDSRPPVRLPEVRLEELEGSWCCEICGSDGSILKRVLEIRGDVLMVRAPAPTAASVLAVTVDSGLSPRWVAGRRHPRTPAVKFCPWLRD